jgi:hypothetical protein
MLRIEGATDRDYQNALFDASNAITDCGGWVTDHKLFSNIMAMLAFVVPSENVQRLQDELENAGISVLNRDDGAPSTDEELPGQLSLTLLHPGPDLKRDVPPLG